MARLVLLPMMRVKLTVSPFLPGPWTSPDLMLCSLPDQKEAKCGAGGTARHGQGTGWSCAERLQSWMASRNENWTC
jgi:hypothetical protein